MSVQHVEMLCNDRIRAEHSHSTDTMKAGPAKKIVQKHGQINWKGF